MRVQDIKMENVLRTYQGRPGCGCGCKGTYRTPQENLTTCKRRVSEIQKDPDNVQVTDGLNGEIIFSSETDKRYIWIYVARPPFEDEEAWASARIF